MLVPPLTKAQIRHRVLRRRIPFRPRQRRHILAPHSPRARCSQHPKGPLGHTPYLDWAPSLRPKRRLRTQCHCPDRRLQQRRCVRGRRQRAQEVPNTDEGLRQLVLARSSFSRPSRQVQASSSSCHPSTTTLNLCIMLMNDRAKWIEMYIEKYGTRDWI